MSRIWIPIEVPHKDICITFEMAGLEFDAVGFMRDGESDISASEMFRRTDNGLIVDNEFIIWRILRHQGKLPAELRGRYLCTKCPGFGANARLQYTALFFDDDRWRECSCLLGRHEQETPGITESPCNEWQLVLRHR